MRQIKSKPTTSRLPIVQRRICSARVVGEVLDDDDARRHRVHHHTREQQHARQHGRARPREPVDDGHAQARAQEGRDEHNRQPCHARPHPERDGDARAQSAAPRHAERQRLCQRIAEHRLERRAHHRERRADDTGHQHARQTQLEKDHARLLVRPQRHEVEPLVSDPQRKQSRGDQHDRQPQQRTA
jgi:hypothetical protein